MVRLASDSWTTCSIPGDKMLVWQWLNQHQTAVTTTAVTGLITDVTITVSSPATFSSPLAVAAPIRRKAPLEFNPYINATELVIEFLAEARRLIPELSRERFLRLTIADFFAFLIRRAAQADGVSPPEIAAGEIPVPSPRHRCAGCGRFLPRRFELLRLYHCGTLCLEQAAARNGICLAGGR